MATAPALVVGQINMFAVSVLGGGGLLGGGVMAGRREAIAGEGSEPPQFYTNHYLSSKFNHNRRRRASSSLTRLYNPACETLRELSHRLPAETFGWATPEELEGSPVSVSTLESSPSRTSSPFSSSNFRFFTDSEDTKTIPWLLNGSTWGLANYNTSFVCGPLFRCHSI